MSQIPASSAAPSRWMIVAAFAAIYILWGSTYIAIRFAVEVIPPFLLGGTRFIIAGLVLTAWARAQGAPWPSWRHWRATLVASVLFFVVNNGALVWATQYVPSGMAALLIGATPMWMVLFDWWRPSVHGRQAGGVRPSNIVVGGLLLGFFGISLLADPAELIAERPEYAIGIAAILVGAVSWAAGSIYTRQAAASLPQSPILSSGMQLLGGGLLLVVLSGITGEWARFQLSDLTPLAVGSWAWLVVCGSILGFGSYIWLMRVSTPARVSTYAYVNPLIAVFLGWALANEPVSPRTLIAAATIIGAVMIINTARTRKPALRAVALTSESSA